MAINTALFANPQIGAAYQNDPRLGYAQALLQNGSSTAPVLSPGEAFARALQAPLGGVLASRLRGGYQAQDQQYRAGLAAALKGDDPVTALSNSTDPTLQQMGLEQQLSLGQARAKAKIDLQNTLAAKGLQIGADGSVQPMAGFGAAQGQIAGQQTIAQTPADVYKAQAMIPVGAQGAAANAAATEPYAVDQASQIAIQNAKIDLQKAAAMGPIATANEVARIKATMPLAVQQAVLTAESTGPVNAQNAALTAQATSPITTQTAVNTANATRLPDLITMVGPNGTDSQSIDKTAPGAADKIRALAGKGYTERPGGVTINMNEDQAKNTQLYTRSQQQLKIATDNWDELAKLGNQAGASVPIGGNFMVSDKYQQASAAVKDIAASYLYSVSGATANPGEVANLVDTIVPKPGDSATTVNEKKQRLTDMVNSIQLRMKPGMAVPTLPGADGGAIPPPPPGFNVVQ